MSSSAGQARAWAKMVLGASRAVPHPPSGSDDAGAPGEPAEFDRMLDQLAIEAGTMRDPVLPPSSGTGVGEPSGVIGLLSAYQEGRASPDLVLADLQARIGPAGPAPEAVLRAIDGAASLAAESAGRWRAGTARALEGIPFGIKDIIDVAGAIVTCGSLLTGERRAATDAAVVARLRAAGAIPFVMLASSEFACGGAHNRRYGVVPNPHDRSRWTGGSSTGSAAALAAGLVPLALGTDTGGSIRIPAAFCGLTGLKPTRGLLPRDGVATLSWTLDHVGPMARSAADLAAVLPVLAGSHHPRGGAGTVLEGLRVGVPSRWFTERCDSKVLEAWRAALAVLHDAGAVLCDVDPGDLSLATEDSWVVLYAELAACQEGRLDRLALFDAGTRDRIARGRAVSAADYLRALRRRSVVGTAMLRAMQGIDVMVTPGAGAEAPRLSDLSVDLDGERVALHEIASRNTMIFDCTGFPALMLPSGTGRDGLPVAIQVVAAPFQDALCIAVGEAFQATTDFHLKVPEEWILKAKP